MKKTDDWERGEDAAQWPTPTPPSSWCKGNSDRWWKESYE